jgi:uncharacterized protein YutE (UPF0331/DUF86 family)
MVNKNKLRQKIAFIEENLRLLRQTARMPENEFIESSLHFNASVRELQVAIEAMIDAASHIVAAERLGFPKTYAETFKFLAAGGIIPHSFVETAQQMVRFRNRAVHLYDEVSPREAYLNLASEPFLLRRIHRLSRSALFCA